MYSEWMEAFARVAVAGHWNSWKKEVEMAAECFFGCLFPCGVLHADSNVWFNQKFIYFFQLAMNIPSFEDIIEPNDQTEARKEHLAKIADLVGNVYPNKFARTAISGGEDTITALKHFEGVTAVEAEMAAIKAGLAEGERPPAEKKDAMNERLKALGTVRVAGRLTTPPRGNFVHLTDGISKLQIYCNKKGPLGLIRNDAENTVDEDNGWALWQLVDHGDLIGVEGYLFVTNTGEVSVHVEKLQFLAKAMLPMPDKMHGIADPELRRRYRYADLIASSLQVEHDGLTTREVFERRAKLISGMRRYLDDHGYVEVETPMLTPKATGAAAKPFETHHNALDIPLYARIAPELYLKRLVVGGFEKVYELNRNFRNEGLSQKHNPEFTMLEFYCAYMDVNGMMDFAEKMIREAVAKANNGSLIVKSKQIQKSFVGEKNPEPLAIVITLNSASRSTPEPLRSLYSTPTGTIDINVVDTEIDFSNFERLTMREAVARYADFAAEFIHEDIHDWLGKRQNTSILFNFYNWLLGDFAERVQIVHGDEIVYEMSAEEQRTTMQKKWNELENKFSAEIFDERKRSEELVHCFEHIVEENLIQPTFIIDYPKSISPLSKASPENPNIAERFELFINGMEVANGFSELNDPKEQYERFVDQMKERDGGDEEAMVLDEDYVRALAYGMPPAAGIGIGIDRLVMLLTNKHSIRDVILFPHMRPEKKDAEAE